MTEMCFKPKSGSLQSWLFPLPGVASLQGEDKGWGKELSCGSTGQSLGRSMGSPELGPVGVWAGRQVSEPVLHVYLMPKASYICLPLPSHHPNPGLAVPSPSSSCLPLPQGKHTEAHLTSAVPISGTPNMALP